MPVPIIPSVVPSGFVMVVATPAINKLIRLSPDEYFMVVGSAIPVGPHGLDMLNVTSHAAERGRVLNSLLVASKVEPSGQVDEANVKEYEGVKEAVAAAFPAPENATTRLSAGRLGVIV